MTTAIRSKRDGSIMMLPPDDDIFFAGEHLSILQGWQEGAILSAYHAIDLVVARDTA